jgi:hypothetical protein
VKFLVYNKARPDCGPIIVMMKYVKIKEEGIRDYFLLLDLTQFFYRFDTIF